VPDQASSFLASLFDFSFSHLVTPRIIKVIYVLAITLAALTALVQGIFWLRLSPALGIFMLLIFGPLLFFWCVIWTRVALEIVMAVFSIVENIRRTDDH
jgi:uncharacterized membrane protein YGL010W